MKGTATLLTVMSENSTTESKTTRTKDSGRASSFITSQGHTVSEIKKSAKEKKNMNVKFANIWSSVFH